MKITIIAGARPNFMKIAPIIHEIKNAMKLGKKINYRLVHTGQHYDKNMSDAFFEQLNIPKPDINLACKSGTHAETTASIMIGFEKDLLNFPADLVLVVGDVTSTMACSIVAQKLNTKVAHVEGGIRSWDWSMPEEINRLVTDSISNYFFTTSSSANENLINSGVDKNNIFFVGNTMIDSLLKNLDKLKKPKIWDKLKLENKKYLVITLHRPANVDKEAGLKQIINEILLYSKGYDIIFPMHPRTSKSFKKLKIENPSLHIIAPLPYLEFIYLIKNSFAVITDSGGITEETTVLNIPCITIRDNTERPETVYEGTNELIGTNPKKIKPTFEKLFSGSWKDASIPTYWDGYASKRIVKKILEINLEKYE